MKLRLFQELTICLACVLLLAACSGAGDDEAIEPPPPPPSEGDLKLGGIYFGQDNLAGIVTEDGGMFLRNNRDGTVFLADLEATDDSFSGDSVRYVSGQPTVPGSVSGTGLSRNTLAGTLTDAKGSVTLQLRYSAFDYEVASSLEAIAGTYTNVTRGVTSTVTINGTDGSISGQDSNSCGFSGKVELVDPHFNAYKLGFSKSCSSTGDINSTGYAHIERDSNPRKVLFFVASNNGIAGVLTFSQ